MKLRKTEVGNRCDACSNVDGANQSAPESTWGYRRGIALVYARVERKTTKERRTLTVQHRGRSCDVDKADGDVRSPSRKDARKFQSADLNAALPISSEKTQRRRRRRKPARDLNQQTALRQNKDDDERGKQQKNKTDITCDNLLLRPDVRRSSRSGEDGGKTGPAPTRTWRLDQLT